MRQRRVLTATIAAWVAGMAPAAAYYHYNHYTPQGIVQEKFDLAALPNRTLTFFVADANNLQYAPNDSFPAVLNQIRQAALAWNSDQSELRVAFGGLTSQTAPQGTPHGLVVFDDIPPGWVAYSTRTVSDMVTRPEGSFVPITQGVVHLNRNLAAKPGPSYMDAFFASVVHEMGHALGLQHTYTSSAMSTITRATIRMKPVEADDVAALAALYPNRSAAPSFGSISGRVTSAGQPVHMASVVALRPAGTAISTLTRPDGTYRIDWLPPDTYWVYVHPLPPNPDMQLPRDAAGQEVPPGEPFATLFYPGTRDPAQFAGIAVSHGAAVEGIDFAVERRASVPVYDVATYQWTGTNYATPAFANSTRTTETLLALGAGLVSNGLPAPDLGIRLLGGSGTVYTFLQHEGALAMYLTFPQFASTGPRHLLFTLPDNAYVLPSGVLLANRPAPVVTAVNGNPDGTVTVTGTGMNGDTRVWFDGLAGTVRTPYSGNEQGGSVVVAPPAGAHQQAAAVAVYNSDGQTSMATQAQNPPLNYYGAVEPPFAVLTPSALPAGVSAMVEVNGINTRFADGQVTLGFGTSDVYTRRVWVLGPTRLIANVTTASNAPAGASTTTVMSGFQLVTQPFGFQVQPPDPQKPAIALPVVNANPAHTVIYPGAAVSVQGSNLALGPTGTAVTVNDQAAQVLSAGANQVVFVVPAGMRTGPAVLRLHNGAESAFPVVIQIDNAPPQLNAVLSSANQPVDASRPAQAGDVLNVLVASSDTTLVGTPSRMRVKVGNTEMPALVLLAAPGQPGMLLAQIILAPTAAGVQVPVTISIDGGPPSNVFYIAVR